MKKCMTWCAVVVSLLLAAAGAPRARADVKLPAVIGSHMVLQRDRPLPIWGWADPGEVIVVRLDQATGVKDIAVRADSDGNWKAVLPALKADGKAHQMTISGKNMIILDDILIGDVWLGSGQSNMEFSTRSAEGGKEAIATAGYPRIRLLHVDKVKAAKPAKDIRVAGGKKDDSAPAAQSSPAWRVCTSESVPGFSAVLYFFGWRLHKDLDVPVGLIESDWGGSPIEQWTVAAEKNGEMYNGMIAPVKPLAIRGVIWYQGEANVGNGLKYYDKMKALIEGWRGAWGYDFPFYFVEIAPWSGYGPNGLPPLWEAQVESLKIPKTGMAVTTDLVPNIKDIHPKKKIEVGNRLALWALAKEYGKTDLVYSGPLYKSLKVEGGKVRLSFAHARGGLQSRDGQPLGEFQIAGADGKFVPAQATISSDLTILAIGDDGKAVAAGPIDYTVVVEAKEVPAPTQVRFGWRSTANPNLVNKEGLPASPFQTENWQGGSGE
jgi:sialate O-acetylesterase